jgi:8-oxo-dGTP pyrophosphatase MutT (NUDIX family)
MISFDTGALIFQVRAAAIIEHERRFLLHRAPADFFWSCPGGRVEVGEQAAATVERELDEELGARATAGELVFLVENFFDYEDRQYHELGLYFATRLHADAAVLQATGEHLGREGDRPLIFRWFDVDELAQATVRPSFLPRALAQRKSGFRHVIHTDTT